MLHKNRSPELCIYTPDNPPKGYLSDVVSSIKKPYLVFEFPHDELIYHFLMGNPFRFLGTIETNASDSLLVNDRRYYFIVTGKRKMELALQQTKLAARLTNNIHVQCKSYIASIKPEKKTKTIPAKSMNYSDLVLEDNSLLKRTANVTHPAYDINHPENKFFFKASRFARSISDIEAFNGQCYRLLLGDRHPDTIAVYDFATKTRMGVASSAIEEYVSFDDYLNSSQYDPQKFADFLINSEAIKVLMAAILEEENDLNDGNWGFRKSDNLAVKIDPDQSTTPLTANYAYSINPKKGLHDKMDPSFTNFRLSEEGIREFPAIYSQGKELPKIKHIKSVSFPRLREDIVEKLRNETKSINDKYYMLLKRILIPKSMYESIANEMFASETKRKKFAAHKAKRTEEIKKVVLNMPEFQAYVKNHPEALQQIKTEFKKYNAMEKNKNMHVDIDEIQNQYDKTFTSFFARHPWVVGVIVAAVITLPIIIAVAIDLFTTAGLFPVTTVGTVTMLSGMFGTMVGASGMTALGVGYGILSALFFAGTASLCGTIAEFVNEIFSGKTSENIVVREEKHVELLSNIQDHDISIGTKKDVTSEFMAGRRNTNTFVFNGDEIKPAEKTENVRQKNRFSFS